MGIWYLDTSALAKLVRPEAETPALRRWLESEQWIISDLHRTELRRAAARAGGRAPARAERFLAESDVLRIDADVFDTAGWIEPTSLRSLDALHLAAAQRIHEPGAGFLTFDLRQAQAARALGLTVVTA